MELVAGDVGRVIQLTLTDNLGNIYNLNGVTVYLFLRTSNGTSFKKTMTIVDAANGVASYTTGSGDLVEGELMLEVELDNYGTPGTVLTQDDPLVLIVRKRVYGSDRPS